ncbi:hypothetical protein R4446_00010 [Acinetobacter baumannii]|nr:hypothetical protein [Acinetobacter baumannii]MDV7408370.1 hypothetical protein [Acinetobacter baumannii]
MKRRFVICLQNITEEQKKNLKEMLKANGVGWWNWVGDTWFVVDNKEKFTAATLRDAVKPIVSKDRFIVLEINEKGDTWAGVTVNDKEGKMFSWIKKFWNK